MEARSSRICVIVTLKNIRFESNAIAPHHHRKHYVVDGRWNLGRKRLDIAAETEKCPDSVGARRDITSIAHDEVRLRVARECGGRAMQARKPSSQFRRL
jgi:hypothetical protein